MPADEFDAEPEAVLRFAAQLADGERRVAGWVDRRASAVRIGLASDAERRAAGAIGALRVIREDRRRGHRTTSLRAGATFRVPARL
ncbi:MAG: hypothetical protein JJE35_14840 [Thermoleophilia bacterium]|nr:hypothetical protein [Thermoleophilia bacterium]